MTMSHVRDIPTIPEHREDNLPTVWLASDLHLGPCQTKLVCVQVKGIESLGVKMGLLSPGTSLAKVQCDFIEELWTGEESLKVPITNWIMQPIVITKDQVVGEIEEVSLVDREDFIWREQQELVARVGQGVDNHLIERKKQLQEQLIIGNDCSMEERSTLQQSLLNKHHVFPGT